MINYLVEEVGKIVKTTEDFERGVRIGTIDVPDKASVSDVVRGCNYWNKHSETIVLKPRREPDKGRWIEVSLSKIISQRI